jgi:hypothetical protein
MGLMRARRLASTVLVALCVLFAVALIDGSVASAVVMHPFVSSFGSFVEVQGVAVDPATGDVFVYDNGAGAVFKYDSSGKPVNFSSLGSTALAGVGSSGEKATQELAISSAGATRGDLYIANGRTIAIYSAETGLKLGELGAGAKGPWGKPCGVAVDPSGNVYVGFEANFVNRYAPTGVVAQTGDYNGSLYGLSRPENCNLAADSAGNVYTVGWEAGPVTRYEASDFNEVSVPVASGKVVDSKGSTVAVDANTDSIYVDEAGPPGQISEFGPHGEPLGNPIVVFGQGFLGRSFGIAVSAATATSGDVYVSSGTGQVVVFGPLVLLPDVTIEPVSNIGTTHVTVSGTVNPDGVPASCVFEYGIEGKYDHSVPCPNDPGAGSSPVSETVELTGLTPAQGYNVRLTAQNAQGKNVASESFATFGPPSVFPFAPSEITKTSAKISGIVYTNGLDTTYHFEYGTTKSYGTSVPVPDVDIGTTSTGIDASLSGLSPGTEYHVRLVASNSAGTTHGPDEAFETLPIVGIEAESVSGISLVEATGLDEATLHARIGPLGDDTTYHFEYGPTGAYGTSVPVSDVDLGVQWKLVSQHIAGLQPGTTYHYRVFATNALGSIGGEDRTFTTTSLPAVAPVDDCPNAFRRAGGLSATLPDCRAYEMVSPLDKNGSSIGADLHFTSQAAFDGQRVSFIAFSGFADTTGSERAGFTSYVATRGAAGWSSHSITPATPLNNVQASINGVKMADLVFTEDLSHAVYLGGYFPGADPGTGSWNLYREDTASRALETVTLDKLHCECLDEEELERLGRRLVGYSSDAGVITFQTTLALVPGATGASMKLYEWDHGVLRLAGILPGETAPAPGGSMAPGGSSSTAIENHNVVSSDGSRVLFVSPASGSAQPQLYMRKNGTSTVWLSRSWTSTLVAEPAGIQFVAASADDTKVLFTSTTPLLNSDTGEGSTGIYLYTDTSGNAESEGKLTFIARVNGSEAISERQHVVTGMSEDGTHIYFFNGKAFPNGESRSAIPREGEYLWDSGALHFVAGVTEPIDPQGESADQYPLLGAADAVRIASDGRRMAFPWHLYSPEREPELAQPGAQQDNSEGLQALYVYDEASEKLTCTSCPPDGSPVTSNAVIASANGKLSIAGNGGSAFYSRFMTNDGRYVFFTTEQSLLPQDTNGVADVYEYNIDKRELRLISSGAGDSGSWFEDASANGSDVFFLTAQKLTGWDTDTLIDLYDARVNSELPESSPPPVPCDGDACQGVPSAAPSFNTASGFTGLGNQHPNVAAVKRKAKRTAKPKKHPKRRGGRKGRTGHAGKTGRSRLRKSVRAGR